MVLADAGRARTREMLRASSIATARNLAVYAKAMFGLALHKQGEKEKLAMILQNIDQYLVAGQREPDGLAEAAGGQLLVVLVRQRVSRPRPIISSCWPAPTPRARWPRGW